MHRVYAPLRCALLTGLLTLITACTGSTALIRHMDTQTIASCIYISTPFTKSMSATGFATVEQCWQYRPW